MTLSTPRGAPHLAADRACLLAACCDARRSTGASIQLRAPNPLRGHSSTRDRQGWHRGLLRSRGGPGGSWRCPSRASRRREDLLYLGHDCRRGIAGQLGWHTIPSQTARAGRRAGARRRRVITTQLRAAGQPRSLPDLPANRPPRSVTVAAAGRPTDCRRSCWVAGAVVTPRTAARPRRTPLPMSGRPIRYACRIAAMSGARLVQGLPLPPDEFGFEVCVTAAAFEGLRIGVGHHHADTFGGEALHLVAVKAPAGLLLGPPPTSCRDRTPRRTSRRSPPTPRAR